MGLARVSGIDYVPASTDLHLPGMAPVFWQGVGHGLRLPAWYPAGPMAEHLAYAIAREPDNLTAHARRVLLCLERPRQDLISGALMDLFIVLNGRGAGLAERLFKLSRPHLSAARQDFFQDWLTRGALDDRPIYDNVHAVLAPPCRGSALTRDQPTGEKA